MYVWNNACEQAFQALKNRLTEAPILAYPMFDKQANPMILQTDASAIGLGADLEQDGHVIAYASWTLSISECNYSVIQRECLAIVWGTKQFRHYFLLSCGLIMSHWSGLLDRKWRVCSTAGCCIAGVQFLNCLSKRNLEQQCGCLVQMERVKGTYSYIDCSHRNAA